MGRFETQWLAAPANLSALANLSGNWIDRARKGQLNREIVLDMDSSVSPTHGEQEQSVWNGHFGFRGDAAFAMPGIYDFLEFEGIDYAIRLPANQILQKEIAHLLKRPVGRPPRQVQRLYATSAIRREVGRSRVAS